MSISLTAILIIGFCIYKWYKNQYDNDDFYYDDIDFGHQANIYWDNPMYSPHDVLPEHMRDPRRSFTKKEIDMMLFLVGHRCEYVDELGRRCKIQDNLHADHHYPHSRGGATRCNPRVPLDPFNNNIVILCEYHNRQKSNIHPTHQETERIHRSRNNYSFPG